MSERGVRSPAACHLPTSYANLGRSTWSEGHGSKVWDVDGTEMIDFHNGFGSMVQGHANPYIVEAVQKQVAQGTHFAAPVEDAIVVSEELARRFGLPQWRYVNSGSRRRWMPFASRGASRAATRSSRSSARIMATTTTRWSPSPCHTKTSAIQTTMPPSPMAPAFPKPRRDLTIAVPFNDAAAMERRIQRLFDEGRPPACVIMEPAMMNLGVVLPEPGYLEAVREITKRLGVVLIFDEVKTGLCVAAGGATEMFGVTPDMVTMAKALGGGLPSGAIGGTEEVMEVVNDGRVYQVGTYNGNPLTMAAARASLEHVLTPDAYRHLDMLNDRMLVGCEAVLEQYGLPGYTVGISSKGCVTFSPTKITDYATFQATHDGELTDLAWLYMMNRGVYMTPGREEEWTLSVAHSVEDTDAYVAAFEELAHDLVA